MKPDGIGVYGKGGGGQTKHVPEKNKMTYKRDIWKISLMVRAAV